LPRDIANHRACSTADCRPDSGATQVICHRAANHSACGGTDPDAFVEMIARQEAANSKRASLFPSRFKPARS